MTTKNSATGERFFGLHMVPGVAEYQDPGKDAYRIFLNEQTIREMDKTFEGRPVFVEHVDGVDDDLDKVRKDADGWVVRSFYNEADGKHWAEFVIVSERGKRAIKRGWRLSNCYLPKSFTKGGLWNGVTYQKEVTSGEYEHLALVPNPRYDESVVLTPDQFKQHNEDKLLELKRLANEKKEHSPMKLSFFKRAKVENAADIEGLSVTLPKSGREISITDLVAEADAAEAMKGKAKIANSIDTVTVAGKEMTVADLVTAHEAVLNAKKDGEKEEDCLKNEEDEEEDKKEKKENDSEDGDGEDEEEKKKKNEADAAAAEAVRVAKEKADRLRNANKNASNEVVKIELASDKVARGKARYGSN